MKLGIFSDPVGKQKQNTKFAEVDDTKKCIPPSKNNNNNKKPKAT